MAARLPASALGCAARQDVEPSATQPGDHPRVQAALVASSPARFLASSPSAPRPAIFRSPSSTGERGPTRSLAPRPFVTPARTFYEGRRTHLRPGLLSAGSNCSFARTARTFSQVNSTRDSPPYRCSRALFARVATTDGRSRARRERPENLVSARRSLPSCRGEGRSSRDDKCYIKKSRMHGI